MLSLHDKSPDHGGLEPLSWLRRLQTAIAPWLAAVRAGRVPRYVGKADLTRLGVIAECRRLDSWITLALTAATVKRLYDSPGLALVILPDELRDADGKRFSIDSMVDGSLTITRRPASTGT